MNIVAFGLSITSAWGNGHATTFRALFRALHERGHDIVFFEKNVEWYASNRDMPEPSFCKLILYDHWTDVLPRVRQELAVAEVALVGSYFPDGVRAIDETLDSNVRVKTFYDIDTPITVAALREKSHTDYLRAGQIAGFDIYFSFTGGPMLREIERRFGARSAMPLYCSVDEVKYRPRPAMKRYTCDLSYMGTYAPDRQPKLEEFLIAPAHELSDCRFLVAGPQYPRKTEWPNNVRRIVHLNPRWHPHFYSSARMTLNVTRRDMVMAGYSPSVRLFEAAACGAAIVSDNWPGLDTFFTPGEQILLPTGTSDVVRYIRDIDDFELSRIGLNARERILSEHTSHCRAQQFEDAIVLASAPSSQHRPRPAIA